MAELLRTEHDHLELSTSVAALGNMIDRLEKNRGGLDSAFEAFASQVEAVVERLTVHFDREEQVLFPFLARELPDTVATLDALESAHDAVCGALLRIAGIVRNGPQGFAHRWPSIVALFRRLDAVYVTHAREEVTFLRELSTRLDPKQRAEVAALLDGI